MEIMTNEEMDSRNAQEYLSAKIAGRIPVYLVRLDRCADGIRTVRFRCPVCRHRRSAVYHTHGAPDDDGGHRVAHCLDRTATRMATAWRLPICRTCHRPESLRNDNPPNEPRTEIMNADDKLIRLAAELLDAAMNTTLENTPPDVATAASHLHQNRALYPRLTIAAQHGGGAMRVSLVLCDPHTDDPVVLLGELTARAAVPN